jgi:hypothetical protein
MTTCTCRIDGRVHNLVIITTIDPHKFYGSIHKHITQAQYACNFENLLEQFILLNCKPSNYIFDSSKNFLPHHIPPNWCSMVYNNIALSKLMIIISMIVAMIINFDMAIIIETTTPNINKHICQ